MEEEVEINDKSSNFNSPSYWREMARQFWVNPPILHWGGWCEGICDVDLAGRWQETQLGGGRSKINILICFGKNTLLFHIGIMLGSIAVRQPLGNYPRTGFRESPPSLSFIATSLKQSHFRWHHSTLNPVGSVQNIDTHIFTWAWSIIKMLFLCDVQFRRVFWWRSGHFIQVFVPYFLGRRSNIQGHFSSLASVFVSNASPATLPLQRLWPLYKIACEKVLSCLIPIHWSYKKWV